MSSRSLRFLGLCGLVLLTGVSVTGCQNGSSVTPQEEAKFKNPPKEMPPEAVRYMQEHSHPPTNAKAPDLGTPK